MKYQALFSSKLKSIKKKSKCCLLLYLFGALRANKKINRGMTSQKLPPTSVTVYPIFNNTKIRARLSIEFTASFR